MQQLVAEGWSQRGEDLARRLREQVEQLEGALFRSCDEGNHANEEHLKQILDMQEALHGLQAERHSAEARVGRREETIRQMRREIGELREELEQLRRGGPRGPRRRSPEPTIARQGREE